MEVLTIGSILIARGPGGAALAAFLWVNAIRQVNRMLGEFEGPSSTDPQPAGRIGGRETRSAFPTRAPLQITQHPRTIVPFCKSDARSLLTQAARGLHRSASLTTDSFSGVGDQSRIFPDRSPSQ
jgi:hypothetical protein